MLFDKNLAAAGGDAALLWQGDEAVSRLLSVILAEIAHNASVDQMHGFFLAAGQRLALSHALGEVRDLAGLDRHCNAVWQALNWGQVRFELDDAGITIVHAELPLALEGDADGVWRTVAPFILQGVYDGWFRQLGSGTQFRTTLVQYAGGHVELRHGI